MLLSRPVIAANITNLTDARYFAARGVGYLLFDLAQIPIDKIIEIRDWVEGPQILILISPETLPLLDECMIRIVPGGVGSTTQQILTDIAHLESHTDLFHLNGGQMHFDDVVFTTVKSVDQLSVLDDDAGIILSGGEEQEVGVKAFEDLDEILDQIELD